MAPFGIVRDPSPCQRRCLERLDDGSVGKVASVRNGVPESLRQVCQ